MNKPQRELLANGLKDLANLTAAALILSQAFSAQKSILLVIVGLLAYMVIYTFAVLLLRGEEND